MRFYSLLLTLAVMSLLTDSAFALNLATSRRDAKFPTQQMVEKQTFTDPLASNMSVIKASGYAGPTSASAVTLTSFSAQPDVPRNLSITPGGTTGDIETCNVVVTGTDIFGATINETFAFASNQASKVIGTRAFKTVASILWPANCESGSFAATWSVGSEEKLGVKRCMANAGDVFHSLLNGAKEATGPTMVVHASQVSSNTADFNGTMDGSADFTLYFMQNYGCFP